METKEEIREVLELAGKVCLLNLTEEFLAIPGFTYITLLDDGSANNINKQEYSFIVSLEDFTTKNISINSTIKYTNEISDYYFVITSFYDTLDGWVSLSVDLQGVENLPLEDTNV